MLFLSNIFAILSVAALIALIVGLFKPDLVLPKSFTKRTRPIVFLFYFIAIILSSTISAAFDPTSNTDDIAIEDKEKPDDKEEPKEEPVKTPQYTEFDMLTEIQQETYIGEYMEWVGIVSSVETEWGQYVIYLCVSDDFCIEGFGDFKAEMKENEEVLLKIKKGDILTIKGKYDGKIFTHTLIDAKIVNK